MKILYFDFIVLVVGAIIMIIRSEIKEHKYDKFWKDYVQKQYTIIDELLEIRNKYNLMTKDFVISLIKQRETTVLASGGDIYWNSLLEYKGPGSLSFSNLPDDGDIPLAHIKGLSKEDKNRIKELAIQLKKNALEDSNEFSKSGIGDAIDAQKRAAQKFEDTAVTRGAIIGGAIGGTTGAVVGAVAAAEKKSNKTKH